MKGTVVDEQARLHRIQLEATTEVWTPCTSLYLRDRITLRGSPSMQELVLGRNDTAGLTMFYNPLRDVFKICDEHSKIARDRVVRVQGSNVTTYTLKMDEEVPS